MVIPVGQGQDHVLAERIERVFGLAGLVVLHAGLLVRIHEAVVLVGLDVAEKLLAVIGSNVVQTAVRVEVRLNGFGIGREEPATDARGRSDRNQAGIDTHPGGVELLRALGQVQVVADLFDHAVLAKDRRATQHGAVAGEDVTTDNGEPLLRLFLVVLLRFLFGIVLVLQSERIGRRPERCQGQPGGEAHERKGSQFVELH